MSAPDVSIIVVSFNTRDLLRDCLRTVQRYAGGLSVETIVVDNVSRDGSADMVAAEFPDAVLIRSMVNLGFAAANNRAFEVARGRYLVLLNSDAFLRPGALERSVAYMDADPRIGLGGARLVGRDDSWQPSARMFPSPVLELVTISGLAAKYPQSRVFGRLDRTWADQSAAAEVDWVPGAYSIIRREALDSAGSFDEKFYLYYEEVDLCRRIQAAGYSIWYWPDVVVEHWGGESSKTVTRLSVSSSGRQLTLWRMRSELIFYRKHHGASAWLVKEQEIWWHRLRAWRNGRRSGGDSAAKRDDALQNIALMRQAWLDTRGGRISPQRPW